MNNYDWLISKLDAFIRKYYVNQLLRGSLILLICLLFYVLTISISEYYLYLPVWLKITLVSFFIFAGSFALIRWVIIPFLKMAKMGSVISHEQAAAIIGKHFPEISDKLLNILQLKKQGDTATGSRELIAASIEQKAGRISVVPITTAVNLKKNRKYLPYLLPLVVICILIMVFSPSIFMDASERLLQPAKAFEKPAPFRFIIENPRLQTVRNTDFLLTIKTEGQALPQEVWVEIGSDKIAMQTVEKNTFRYNFKNLTESVSFKLYAGGYYSQPYKIEVVQKPVLKAIKLQLDYPEYTGKKDEIRHSLGDITLPMGTVIRWGIAAEHTDKATLKFGEGQPIPLQRNAQLFGYSARFLNDTVYTISLSNQQSKIEEAYRYSVHVIPDQFPVIQLQEFRDSVSGKQILLNGTAGDDYGITKVLFHYTISNDKNQPLTAKSLPLKTTQGAFAAFQHYFDVELLQLQPGQKVTYYIEAWDNDGVQGSKASRSEVMSYQMFDASQLDSAILANAEQISSGLSNSSQQTKELQKDIQEMQSKMLQTDKMDWEQQQSLQELMQKQQQLKQNLENTKKRFEEQMQQSKQKEYSEDLKEKQEALQKQMDNMLNKELAEMMKKIQEMMQKLNKENAFQTMKEMEQQNKLFNMDVERMKELMKKLELQMRMEDMANKADKLAEQQLQLKEETDADKKTNDALSQEQQDLKKQLDELMKNDMKEMQELNKQMQQQQDLSDVQKSGSDAQQDMQQSQQELNQGQKSKAGQQQKQAAQNLKQMVQSLQKMAGGMSMEQIELDIKAVRQILTNLMRLSFDQEQLMDKVRQTSPTTQAYLKNQQEQNRLHHNSFMIRDSLFALSKRLFKLAPTINRETTELEKNMQLSLSAIENRRINEAVTRQQYVMMRTNNLALMLNETLANLMAMQSQMMKDGEKQGSCEKPGGKKPKPGAGQQMMDIITQQQQLGDAMQQMKNAQEKRQGQQGEKPGGEQKQQAGSEGEYGDAEQLARMAAQQAALRRQLQELQSLMNSKGMGNAKQLRDIQEKMDKNETDLVNRRLSSEMIIRQQEILTRLLQTEKALREQDQDDKRASKNPQELSRTIPPELKPYMQDPKSLIDFYKTIPPQLKPYYRNMVNSYYKIIGN